MQSYKGLFMQRNNSAPSLLDEKKSQSETSLHDLPLSLTSSIKLLSDVIALSKFFIKKPTIQNSSSPTDAADTLINEILLLDIERDTPKDKRYKLSASYVAMAKADLFPNIGLTKKDLELLLKFAFLKPLKQGEHIAFYFKREHIFQYVDQCINVKYQEKFKQIIDRACALAIIGFASYNLLISRRTSDKNQSSIATPFDPLNIIATEKNIIIRLIEEISTLKPSTTHSGDITRYQKEIAADIDQIRTTFESIELELIKIELNHKQQLLEKLVPVFLKIKSPMMDVDPDIKNFGIIRDVRNTKRQEQLLKEIEELETKQAFILAKIESQKSALEIRAKEAENKFDDLNIKYDTEINKKESLRLELELENKKLQNNLNHANAIEKKLRQEIHQTKNKIPLWYYGLAITAFVVGAALCSSGIGLLAIAFILGVTTLVLSCAIMLASIGFTLYNIYRQCKHDHNIPPPSESPTHRIITNHIQMIPLPRPLELKSNQVTLESEDPAPISTQPMFSPRSQNVTDKEHQRPPIISHIPSPGSPK